MRSSLWKKRFLIVPVVAVALLSCASAAAAAKESSLTCSADDNERDPALREMSYNVGDGEQTTWVYIEPDIASFYQGNPPASTKVTPKHNGFSAKFINMSNQKLTLYWEERVGGNVFPMRTHLPFEASGTASFPNHRFFFAPDNDPDTRLKTFILEEYPDNIHYYDPYRVENDPKQTAANLAVLTDAERAKYEGWHKTLVFHEQYLAFTGRSYLANYLRKPPSHFMWRADYFGQEHWVTTQETHFTKLPPKKSLKRISPKANRKLSEPQLQDYRAGGGSDEQKIFNMTLKVLSCAPRAFEIPNFLSDVEVAHILDIAAGVDLKASSTGDGGGDRKTAEENRGTRTSFNSWLDRETSPILDAIYRRAADLMRMDEALLRSRGRDEVPELTTTKASVSESLQLVHYAHAQEYTAHHDFGFSRIDDVNQGARFATILFYLNEGMVGGETSFPRWVNAESFQELAVKPEAGKAVLFYSQLPDGNLDDFSHHAAKPVTEGEKWLTNLWIWSPVYAK